MLNFFYDSLETLKKVRKPTNSEVTTLTIIIFVVVVIAALMFALMDGIFGEVYNMIYETLRGAFGSSVVSAPVDVLPADIDLGQAVAEVAEPTIEVEQVPAPSAVDAAIDAQQ